MHGAAREAGARALPPSAISEHRQRRADRVRDRDRDRLQAELDARRDDRDRADHRPAAGHEHEAEAHAEQEAAAEVAARGAAAEARERPLEQHARPAARSASPRAGSSSAIETLRRRSCGQAELRRAARPRTSVKDDEARDEAGDDRVRPPAAAGGPAREARSAAPGSTHGEIAVTIPATKAMGRSSERTRVACATRSVSWRRLGRYAVGGRSGLLLAASPRRAAPLAAACCCRPWAWPFFLRLRRRRRERPARGLRRGQVVGERVRDLLDRAELARAPRRSAGSRAACSPRPRRAAPRRPRAAARAPRSTSFAAFSSCRWPREFASAPSSRFASGNSALAWRSCTLRVARASRHVQRARICSGASGLALADRAQQRSGRPGRGPSPTSAPA